MPWWAELYLAVFTLLTVLSLRDEVSGRKSPAYIAVEVVSSLGWIWLIVANFHPALAASVGRGATVAFVFVLAGTAVGVQRDIAALRPDDELSPRANYALEMLGVCLAGLLFAPAVYWGGMTALRAWKG